MGLFLPRQIDFWGIEAQKCYTFGEILSPEVTQAVPLAVAAVLEDLGEEIWIAD